MALKKFETLAVVGAYTGRLLEEGGFGKIHEVMDHMYPGIMHMGMASKWKSGAVKAYLEKAVPGIAVLGSELDESVFNWEETDYREVAERARRLFGGTIEFEGPAEVIDPLALELAFLREHKPDAKVIILEMPQKAKSDGP